jgi:ubiquinone biosynthesis protein
MAAVQSGQAASIQPQQIAALLAGVDLEKWRQPLLEWALHHSAVLELLPESASGWMPIVHDFLLFFLDRLPEERLGESLLGQLSLTDGSERGQRMLRLAQRTPTLQKLGQIFSRNPAIAKDLRQALQTLENSISTTPRDELVEMIRTEVGTDAIEKYRIQFADHVLAEASIGAVIRCTMVLPGETQPRRAVCKAIKPYALKALRQELDILIEVAAFFEAHHDFYDLGTMPLSEMFQDVREALSNEIQVVEEQKHLARAAAYYQGDGKVKIPEIYPGSNDTITFMEYIDGAKITEAFPNDPKARAKLAQRLNGILTFDVIFASQDVAIFHGDPHAGNVFFVRNDPKDPYRIALLDWGVSGALPRRQRAKLVQLMLGLRLGSKKRVRQSIDSLIEGEIPNDAAANQGIDRIIESALQEKKINPQRQDFDILSDLVGDLTKLGYSIDFNLVLFIKSQMTVAGILKELDPKIKPGQQPVGRALAVLLRETPKRLLNSVYFPNWNSHKYPTMLSNADLFRYSSRAFGRLIWKGIRWPFAWVH